MTQVKENQKKEKRFNFSSILLGKLTRNACFLIFLICLILFLLYLLGNFQTFTDRTQITILSVLSVTASALCILSVFAFVMEIALIFIKKKKTGSVISMLFFVFTLVTGGVFFAFSVIINRIASGI